MTNNNLQAQLNNLPPDMLEFTILKATTALAPRLGRLTLPGRNAILTPGFLGNTSRGVVPHISQDNFRKCTSLKGVYIAIEDFIEKMPQKTPPIFQLENQEPLRRFVALSKETLLIMGARRSPPIPSPVANTNTEVGLWTSVGFQSISSETYAAAVRKLQPDIVIGLADIPFGQEAIGSRRKDKMSDRTERWTRDIIAKLSSIDKEQKRFSIFAPILPVERDLQAWYLEHLVDEMAEKIHGVAIYDVFLADSLPEELHDLPRLSFDTPATPQALLRQINLGMDLFTVPFVADATDAGIALDFTFPAPRSPTSPSTRQSLGVDMWRTEHALSLDGLTQQCKCYACTNHHRAYVQHLLSAKEMLGWVLIQLHNLAIMEAFFSGVRNSIENNTFEEDVAAFEAYYEPALPEKTGQGPRVRGYQFKSEGNEARSTKKNPKAYRRLNGEEGVKLHAMHGQQPNKKPQVKDQIDDEALIGLMDLENMPTTQQLDTLKLEDDNL